jgi:putative ABC transport system permease protein
MTGIRVWLKRLRSIFQRDKWEAELTAELESHLQMHVAENVRAGMSPQEARRVALLKLGGVEQTKDRYREQRVLGWVETTWQDLRLGLRILTKNPRFTSVATLILALGIGANTAVFSVMNTVLLKPLPYPDANRIVMLHEKIDLPTYTDEIDMLPAADFGDWAARDAVFESIAGIKYRSFDLAGYGEPIRMEGASVSATLFSVLRVDPLMGRVFSPDEDHHGGPRVVLLGYGLWASHFGANPRVIGQAVRLNGESYTVIGVMPKWFHFPDADDQLWVPLDLGPEDLTDRARQSMLVVGKLRQAGGLAEAQAEMDSISRTLAREYPATHAGMRVHLVSVRDQVVGEVRPAILILWGSTTFVFLIVCANIANLLLTRSMARRQEFAIRVALGAPLARIGRQLLTESLLLGLLGGVFGLAFALGGMHAIRWLSPPDAFPYLPRLDEIGFDPIVLAFAAGVSLFAGLVFGLVPAFQVAHGDLNEPLRESSRGAAGGKRRSWTRMVLIVAETALGTSVLVGAGLLFRSFVRLEQVPLGFQTKNVFTLRLIPQGPKYASPIAQSNFYQSVLKNIESIPGVQSAGAINFLPLTQVWHAERFSVEGQTPSIPGEQPVADFRPVTPRYFQSLGIPIETGRDFSWADVPDSLPVVIVSEAVARRFWPNGDALGQHIKQGLPDAPARWLTVVAVVGDLRYYDVVNKPRPTIYLPFTQGARANLSLHDLVVRTAVSPSAVSSALRRAVWAVDRDVPLSRMRSMDEVYSIAMAPHRFNLLLLGLMAGLVVVLAALGVYGVTAYNVQKQTWEIGIRMALGAEPHKVVTAILFDSAKHALFGVAIGILLALLLNQVIKALLFAVSATDKVTYFLAAAFLGSIVLLASYVPARRAAHLDPAIALREQ